MKHRSKTNKRKDRKFFSRNAGNTKKINVAPKVMRGGIRL